MTLFPLLWSDLPSEERDTLLAGVTSLLASDLPFLQQSTTTHHLWEELDKDYKQWGASTPLPFAQQAASRYGTIPVTNGLQALLDALLRCTPQPRLPPVLLLHLAKNYGCGPQATLLLEAGLREAGDAKERKAFWRCLKALYVIARTYSHP